MTSRERVQAALGFQQPDRDVQRRLALRLRTLDQLFVQELERKTAEFEAQVDKLHLLIEATKTVNSTINSDELLGLILTAATTSIRADRGTLYLIDPVTNELWSKVTNGTEVVEIRMPMGKGLAGYVAKTGETVNIPDAYKDPRFNPEIDKKSGYKTQNVLCMPLRDKAGTIIGVFQLLNKRGGSFTKDDEEFIQALSVHAAIALENARLVKELVQNERLSTIGRMASSIIHDIKNPMAAMRIHAQLIKAKTQNKEAAEIAEMMMKQVDRFVNMTQEILDFSRGVSDMNIEEVELGTLPPSGELTSRAGQSGINLRDPADSGISLERESPQADEIDFELSLDPDNSLTGPKTGPKGGSDIDSDSEFELTLDELKEYLKISGCFGCIKRLFVKDLLVSAGGDLLLAGLGLALLSAATLRRRS